MKRIPKRYRPFVNRQEPTARLLGMTFRWNERVWRVTGFDSKVALIVSGKVKSKIDLILLPKVAESVRAAEAA
jgi:hypothetical protein